MNLTRDSMLALQRHFLGALSAPARTWLEPLPATPLAFAGSALRVSSAGSCVLDFGLVEPPGEEHRLVRVFHRGGGRAELGELPSWLTARWIDADTLEVVATHEVEGELHGSISFLVAGRIETLNVRMTARRLHPFAQLDFNGSPAPRPFDFGEIDLPYVLSVANATSVPLVVTFADLPAWLTFEVDGKQRSGPIDGPFFERPAPFAAMLRPQFLGRHTGVLRIRTNDPRPELHDIELQLSAWRVAAKPCVHVVPPRPVRLRADQTFTTTARLENWGRLPARTTKREMSAALDVREWPVVPAAHDGQPGAAAVSIRIVPARLAPGLHKLPLSLRVEDGEPAEVVVPVLIDVTPQRHPALRLETAVALFALLLLTLLFVVVRGLP